MNTIHQLTILLTKLAQMNGAQTIEQGLEKLIEQMGSEETQLHLLELFDDSIDLLSKLDTPSAKKDDAISLFAKSKLTFLKACRGPRMQEYRRDMPLSLIRTMDAYVLLVDYASIENAEVIDREDLTSETKKLAAHLQQADLPDLAKGALILKLLAFSKIVDECQYYSDDHIRRRIKVIFADYCAEMEILQKEDQETKDKMIGWAKKYASKGSQALQLTASAVGLIEHLST